jgi:hypothetical protein
VLSRAARLQASSNLSDLGGHANDLPPLQGLAANTGKDSGQSPQREQLPRGRRRQGAELQERGSASETLGCHRRGRVASAGSEAASKLPASPAAANREPDDGAVNLAAGADAAGGFHRCHDPPRGRGVDDRRVFRSAMAHPSRPFQRAASMSALAGPFRRTSRCSRRHTTLPIRCPTPTFSISSGGRASSSLTARPMS